MVSLLLFGFSPCISSSSSVKCLELRNQRRGQHSCSTMDLNQNTGHSHEELQAAAWGLDDYTMLRYLILRLVWEKKLLLSDLLNLLIMQDPSEQVK